MFGAWARPWRRRGARCQRAGRTDIYALLGAARRVDLVEGADRQE